MASDVLLTIFLVAIAIVVFLGFVVWRHHDEHRRIAMDYEGQSRMPPPSTVCPQCRRRSYSRRAVEEGYCEQCDLHYGRQAAA